MEHSVYVRIKVNSDKYQHMPQIREHAHIYPHSVEPALDEGNFWCIIEKVCKMTEPLLKMITLLETDTPSMSKIFPLLKSKEVFDRKWR
jgi:hypothetical protein